MHAHQDRPRAEHEKWNNLVQTGTLHYRFAEPLMAYASIMGYDNAKIYQKVVKERIFALAQIQENENVLDAGCGAGFLGKIAVKCNTPVIHFVGIDFSKQLLSRAAGIYIVF